MNKDKVFLDLSALYRLFLGKKELSELLSEKLASKINYVTSPIVVQELIFSIDGLDELAAQLDLEELERQVELVPLNYDNIEAAFRENRHDFDRLGLHSNDVVSIVAAEDANCDYLLTDDEGIIEAVKLEERLKVLRPEEFLASFRNN